MRQIIPRSTLTVCGLLPVCALCGCGTGDGSPSGLDTEGDVGSSADIESVRDTGAEDLAGPGVDSGSTPDARVVVDDTPAGLTRVEDPVVVLGAQLSGLSDVAAGDLVAFARREGAWVAIPVQVDERRLQDFCEVYGKSSGLWTSGPACKSGAEINALFYTDTETFTGADPDPMLDGDVAMGTATPTRRRAALWTAFPSTAAAAIRRAFPRRARPAAWRTARSKAGRSSMAPATGPATPASRTS